jgi:hypothetical protein
LRSHSCDVLTEFVVTLLFHPRPTAQTGFAPN